MNDILAYKNVADEQRDLKSFRKGDFLLEEKVLSEKKALGRQGDQRYYLRFGEKKGSVMGNQSVSVSRGEFDQAQEGDRIYLLSINGFARLHYRKDQYEPDETLRERLQIVEKQGKTD